MAKRHISDSICELSSHTDTEAWGVKVQLSLMFQQQILDELWVISAVMVTVAN